MIMQNVFDVAEWFLAKEPMTHKKIQKLCYYAQAWHCALFNGKRLFADDFQAWIHGPVCRPLFDKYHGYGWLHIPKADRTNFPFTEDESNVLESVYYAYGHLDGDQLEALTHKESPWLKARGDIDPAAVCTNIISTEDMRACYAKQYEEEQND